MNSIDSLIKGNIQLPSPPAVAIRILESVKKDDAGYDELAGIISSDPALAAKILKVANSSAYALPQKVESIQKAIAVLGVNALKNIALSFVITKDLQGGSENGFDFQTFWKRSVTAGIAADLFAVLAKRKSDDAFVTGLLQDIGIVIMYLCRPDDYMRVLDEKNVAEEPVNVIEKNIFGFDHQEVGSEILEIWGLPENIYGPIRYHHADGEPTAEHKALADTLIVSDKISSVYHGSHGIDKIEDIKQILNAQYGISEDEIENLIDSVASRTIEVLSVFEIDPGDMRPYSQILQDANKELGRLNLSYEYLLMKYKDEKERSANLAQKLKKRNEELRKMALMDGLTGLYNHRHFQDSMDKEISRATRYSRPLSVIMFDLDHFKIVNDSYGHRAGDIVLKQVSAKVQEMVRANDIAARYGGEEFMIILPETELKGAAVLAERIRVAVEEMEIVADTQKIKVTVSLGVSTCLPGEKKVSKTEILDAADAALYNSKDNGRNKLSLAKIK